MPQFSLYIVIMKEQLTKFKTQYDLHANYNQKGLFQAQKKAYDQEIHLSDRLQDNAQKNFTMKPLQIGFIQSLTLKEDPKFKEIQKIYQKYNAQVVEMTINPASGLHLKKVVMQSMLKFLRMMMLAPDATSKKTILDISFYWFIKHLNPKSQRKPQAAMLKQIKKIITENNLLPREIIEKELPSQKLKEELHYYRVKARTQHRDLDAPQHQLENYHIHKVGYITEKTAKGETQQELRRKRLLRLKFIKPNLEQYYLPPPQEQPKQPQKIQPVPQAQVSTQPPAVQDPNLVPPVQQPPINEEMAKQMQMLNQMGGQPQEPQQHAIEQDQEKKRGKLDPLVKVFLKRQLQEQKEKELSKGQISITQLQRYRNNYKQVLQRQDEIFAKHMNDWGSKKARLKTEAARRVQSIRMNHTQIVQSTPPNKGFEQSFYETRINQVLKEGRMYVKGELSRQKLNTEASFSCFDRRRIKTVACSANKPFSAIIQQNKRGNLKEQALDEISYIKQKFAKQKIFASLQAMKNGLMHPEQGIVEKTQRIQYPTNLLSNPFFVVKKKKKKGKKKK